MMEVMLFVFRDITNTGKPALGDVLVGKNKS